VASWWGAPALALVVGWPGHVGCLVPAVAEAYALADPEADPAAIATVYVDVGASVYVDVGASVYVDVSTVVVAAVVAAVIITAVVVAAVVVSEVAHYFFK
jgi:hypothetical protein